MKLLVVILLIGSVLRIVFGQEQCGNQQKCVRFHECPDFRSYKGPPGSWPPAVQNKLRDSLCSTPQEQTEHIIKICCNKQGVELLDLEKCGKKTAERVAHGKTAKVFEFPWMALLGGKKGAFHCGGSLISQSFVLTAAHCNRKQIVFVRVGETDLSSQIDCYSEENSEEDCAEEPQDIPVAKCIEHKKYSISNRKHDIALIKLQFPVRLNQNVRPICLPLPEMLPESPKPLPRIMTVSGWGYTEGRDAMSEKLRYAFVPIMEQSHCQRSIKKLSNAITVDESQVCAGEDSDLADSCRGDSGGPLQYPGRNATLIHGIVSFGLSTCGIEKGPSVYTKVSHYMTWILDNLNHGYATLSNIIDSLSKCNVKAIPFINRLILTTRTAIFANTVVRR